MKAIRIKLTVVSLSLLLLGGLSVRSQAKPRSDSGGDQNNSTSSNPDTPPPPDQQGKGGAGGPSEGSSHRDPVQTPQAPSDATQSAGGCCGGMGGGQ